MYIAQEFTQAEQTEALDQGLCPRCKGSILDLRNCGFSASQVGTCFRFGAGSWECRKMRPGSRSGIHISDVKA